MTGGEEVPWKNTSKKSLLKFGRVDLALTFALPIKNGVVEKGISAVDLRGKSSLKVDKKLGVA